MELITAMAASKDYCNAMPQILLAQLPRQTQIGSISRCLPLKKMKRELRPVVRAKSDDRHHEGSGGWNVVDANMTVLRKRISEMKAKEENYELPDHWMEWEKDIHPSYHTIVLEAIGWLHYSLINCRPSVGIALLSSIMVVPTSVLVAIMAVLHQLTSNS